jgi:hypothetical protein
MASQALIGMLAFIVQFAVAIWVFNLNVVGNYAELALFLMLGTITILGIVQNLYLVWRMLGKTVQDGGNIRGKFFTTACV